MMMEDCCHSQLYPHLSGLYGVISTFKVPRNSVKIYRNPRRTDWKSFRTDLSGGLRGMTDKINNFIDLEIAADQFQEAITFAYNENCPLP